MKWIYLGLAIVSEVIASSALRASDGFTRVGPTLALIIGYGVSFYFLSLTLRTIPMGIAYAVWSGVGILLICIVGWMFFEQKLDLAAIVGLIFIVTGVVILNVFSKSAMH
ncbi:MAG: multidrug transporter [Burkholderiales bacterium RIFCSPLOWO2_02_FULL_57_36]|nr:MAG: multidrug transporter [Burkholderiales bacterium RIFCSPLOWO2_02_FULL_57_36]